MVRVLHITKRVYNVVASRQRTALAKLRHTRCEGSYPCVVDLLVGIHCKRGPGLIPIGDYHITVWCCHSKAMLPVANLQTLYDSTVEFFALRSPSFSFRGTPTTTEDPASESDRSRVLTPVPDPVERLTRECVSLRERLNAADRRHSACPNCQPLGSSNTTLTSIPMRREFDVMKNELARSRTEVTKLEERCKLLEKTLKETRDLVRARDMELERIRKDDERQRPGASRRGSSASEMQTADSQRREVTAEESMLQSQRLRPSPSRNGLQRGNIDEAGRTIAAMEESRAQARCLEIFMTRTDSWSGAQVLQAVHDLNSEILQFAASATELCTFERTTARSTPSRSGQAVHDTSSRLGAHVTRVLTTRDHAQDPILVQIALQGCISTCIARALSTFCMGFPSKSDVVLAQIYSSMFVNGEPYGMA